MQNTAFAAFDLPFVAPKNKQTRTAKARAVPDRRFKLPVAYRHHSRANEKGLKSV